MFLKCIGPSILVDSCQGILTSESHGNVACHSIILLAMSDCMWERLSLGTLKINFDDRVLEDGTYDATASVIKDYVGKIMVSREGSSSTLMILWRSLSVHGMGYPVKLSRR